MIKRINRNPFLSIRSAMNYFGLVLLFSSFLFSCSSYKSDYKYFDGLVKYMNEQHRTNIQDNTSDQYYYLIMADADCVCTTLNLNSIKQNLHALGKNLTVLLIGEVSEDLYQNYVNDLAKVVHIIYDKDKAIYQYRTAIGKPIFIHTYGPQLKYGKIVNDPEVQLIADYVSDKVG